MDILDYPHVVLKKKPTYRSYVCNKILFHNSLLAYFIERYGCYSINVSLEKDSNNKYKIKITGPNRDDFIECICKDYKVDKGCYEEVFKMILRNFICKDKRFAIGKEVVIREDNQNYYVFIKL